eukprot:753645-Hanusia_phi.AAC.2
MFRSSGFRQSQTKLSRCRDSQTASLMLRQAFCDKNKDLAPKYTIGLDTNGSVSRGYPVRGLPLLPCPHACFKVEGIPAAFVVDKKGLVTWQGHPMSDLEQVTSPREAASETLRPQAIAEALKGE